MLMVSSLLSTERRDLTISRRFLPGGWVLIRPGAPGPLMAVLTSDARSGILPPGTDQDSAARPEFQGARTILRNFFEMRLSR
jgi:hypothetical protein